MAAEYIPLAGSKAAPKTGLIGLGGLSPITAEVQQREEQRVARDALLDAAKSDQERREGILQAAQTGGRRQAAEALLQGTRGMEVGTGASAAMGRQAAADVLMQEQQMAAARAAETPAFSMAELEKNLLSEGQALGTLQTDQMGKIIAYKEAIDSYSTEDGDALGNLDATIDTWLSQELMQPEPDWLIINWLNSQRSEPNPAYGLPYGGDEAPMGVWYQSEDGQWVMNTVGEDGLVVTDTYQGEGKPTGAVENLGVWVKGQGDWWYKEYVDENGVVQKDAKQTENPGGPDADEAEAAAEAEADAEHEEHTPSTAYHSGH